MSCTNRLLLPVFVDGVSASSIVLSQPQERTCVLPANVDSSMAKWHCDTGVWMSVRRVVITKQSTFILSIENFYLIIFIFVINLCTLKKCILVTASQERGNILNFRG